MHSDVLKRLIIAFIKCSNFHSKCGKYEWLLLCVKSPFLIGTTVLCVCANLKWREVQQLNLFSKSKLARLRTNDGTKWDLIVLVQNVQNVQNVHDHLISAVNVSEIRDMKSQIAYLGTCAATGHLSCTVCKLRKFVFESYLGWGSILEYFTSILSCLQRKHLAYEYFVTVFFFTGRSC